MNKLEENLQAIKTEKEKLNANEILKGKTLFGIEGKLSRLDALEMGAIPTHTNGFGLSGDQNPYEERYFTIPLGYDPMNNDRPEISELEFGAKDLLLHSEEELHGMNGFSAKVMAKDLFPMIGITSDKIVKGNNIMGLEGTGDTDIPFEDEPEYARCLALANDILGITDTPVLPSDDEQDNVISSKPTP